MKVRVLSIMLLAVALSSQAHAAAPGALGQARGVSSDPLNFDGARSKPEAEAVRAGAAADRRTAGQIAMDEQTKADERSRANLTAKDSGADQEIAPPKPNEWLKRAHIFSGMKGGLIGLLIGSLWGLTGLGVGVLVGGLIGYSLSRFAASDE
jgi:hypothetical protein